MFNSRNIKQSDIIRIEAGLRSILREQFPSLNINPGSNLNDILIRSLAYTTALINTEAEEVKTRLSLNKVLESTRVDKQQILEDIASNFLIFSNTLVPAKGVLTLRFSSAVNRTITSDINFVRGDNVHTVKPVDTETDIAVTSTDYIEETLDDGTVVYNYTIFCESINTSVEETIQAGDFTSSVDLVGLIKVFNLQDFTQFDPNEFQDRDIRSRMELALTARGFHTRNAIRNTLLEENLTTLTKVLGVGAADPEMQRDIVPTSVVGEEFHSLGMINVVIGSDLVFSVSQITGTTISNIPLLFIRNATRTGTTLSLISDFTYSTTQNYRITRSVNAAGVTSISGALVDSSLALPTDSIRIGLTTDSDKLKYGVPLTNKHTIEYATGDTNSCELNIAKEQNITAVQGLIDSSQYNTLGSDTLAIACNIVQVIVPDLKIEVIENIATTSINTDNIRRVIQSTINSWTEDRAITHLDILSPVSIFLGGTASNIEFNTGFKYILYLPDGRELLYTTTNKLSVMDTNLQVQANILSATDISGMQISNKTLKYVIYPEDITIQVTQDV